MSPVLRSEYTRKLNEGIFRFLERLGPPEGLEVKVRNPLLETAEFFAFNPNPPEDDAKDVVILPLRKIVIARSSAGNMTAFIRKELEPMPMLYVRDDHSKEPMPYLPLLLAQVFTAIAEFYVWVAKRSKILVVRRPFEVKSETFFDTMKTLYRCDGRYGWEESDDE